MSSAFDRHLAYEQHCQDRLARVPVDPLGEQPDQGPSSGGDGNGVEPFRGLLVGLAVSVALWALILLLAHIKW